MQLIEVPAKTGYVWFRQGIWLFRRNPLAFLTLFFAYLLAMTAISLIPIIGGVLPLMLIPGIAVGFMSACRDTIAGKPVLPTILVDGFRAYGGQVAKRLLLLGVLYIIAMAVVLMGSALADGGTLLHLMISGESMQPEAIVNSDIPFAVLTALAAVTPLTVAPGICVCCEPVGLPAAVLMKIWLNVCGYCQYCGATSITTKYWFSAL